MRRLAIIVGIAIVGAATHVSIVFGGGYAGVVAPLQIAIASGLCVSAVALGITWQERRWTLAAMLALALASGEAFGILQTGERTIAARDLAQAPARAAIALRLAAEKRLEVAEGALARAEAEISDKAAEIGCKRECAKLLTDAKEAAVRERDAARAALAVVPAAPSASPLADRLGIEP